MSITYQVTVFDNRTEWRLNGQLHREDDLPAVEYANGNKAWYKNGECHREDDLPAIEYADGNKVWYKNGKYVTEEEHKSLTSKTKELTVAQLEEILGYSIKIVK